MNIAQNFLNINPYSLKKKDKLKKFLNYLIPKACEMEFLFKKDI